MRCSGAVALVLLVACSEPPSGSAPNARPDVPVLELDPVPILTLGLDPDDPAQAFQSITWAALLQDSLVVVADDRALRIGLYGLDGSLVRWLVREGDGPGEVRHIGAAGILDGRAVWTVDHRRRRITVLDLQGEIVGEAHIPAEAGRLRLDAHVIGPAGSDGWWIRQDEQPPQGSFGEFFRVPVTFSILTADGTLGPRWTGDGEERLWLDPGPHARATRITASSPRLHATALEGDLVFAWSDSSWIARVSPSRRVVRWSSFEPRRRPVHRHHIVPESELSEASRLAFERYRLLPEIEGLLASPDGGVWARQADGEDGPVTLHRTRRRRGGTPP